MREVSRRRRSSEDRGPGPVSPAPLGVAAVLGCCAVHALVVGGVTATTIAWLGIPAAAIGILVASLWWGSRRR